MLDCPTSNRIARRIYIEWLPMYALTPKWSHCKYRFSNQGRMGRWARALPTFHWIPPEHSVPGGGALNQDQASKTHFCFYALLLCCLMRYFPWIALFALLPLFFLETTCVCTLCVLFSCVVMSYIFALFVFLLQGSCFAFCVVFLLHACAHRFA